MTVLAKFLAPLSLPAHSFSTTNTTPLRVVVDIYLSPMCLFSCFLFLFVFSALSPPLLFISVVETFDNCIDVSTVIYMMSERIYT